MEMKPAYKQTEAGVIPEDWGVRPLCGLATIMHGFGFQSRYFKPHGKFRLTTPGHFHERGGFRDVGDKQRFYDGPVPDGFVLREGDLIVAMTEQADGLLGSAAFIPLGGCYLHNQRLGKVTALSPEVSTRFLYCVFNSRVYRSRVRETAAGTKVKHTSPAKLLSIPVLLPPTKAEQETIAEALSDVDALIGSLGELIARKRQIKQGAMQELLTGKKRLPAFSGGWGVKPFGAVLSRLNVKPHQIQTSDYRATGRYPVVDQGKNRVVGFSDRHEMRFQCPADGVIVFGDHTCIVKFVDFDFLVGADGTQVMAAKQGQCARFHAYQLQYQGISPTGYNRHFKALRERDFLAPSFPEQTAIARVLSDMDAEIAALEADLTKTRQLKQGMMQELLTGRIRLI